MINAVLLSVLARIILFIDLGHYLGKFDTGILLTLASRQKLCKGRNPAIASFVVFFADFASIAGQLLDTVDPVWSKTSAEHTALR